MELDFSLTLGSGAFDRVGVDDGVSWWASGAPLLAWEPGVGWARDPFVAAQRRDGDQPGRRHRGRASRRRRTSPS